MSKLDTHLKKFIYVWIVSEDAATIQSTEFALEKDKLKKSIWDKFSIETTLIVKNIYGSNHDDTEVIRNLKLALKPYSFKNIEVIDNDLNMENIEWLIDATKDYIIKSNKIDYFSIIQ